MMVMTMIIMTTMQHMGRMFPRKIPTLARRTYSNLSQCTVLQFSSIVLFTNDDQHPTYIAAICLERMLVSREKMKRSRKQRWTLAVTRKGP